jgi:Fur family transcriptional regulator, ferric uptake regulator
MRTAGLRRETRTFDEARVLMENLILGCAARRYNYPQTGSDEKVRLLSVLIGSSSRGEIPILRLEIEFHFQQAGVIFYLAPSNRYRLQARPGQTRIRIPHMLQKRIDDQPSISREMVREAQEILHQHLKRVGLKQTAQRDTILRTFLETRDHLSTDELHRLVQKKDSGIGFTTVYRTLKLLAECGLASEVAFHDGIARYEHQYNRRSHHHMVCTGCGSSVEFFSHEVGELEQEIGRKYHYATTRHTFQIYGVCEECRKKNGVSRPV